MSAVTKAAAKSYVRALATAVLAVAVAGASDWLPYAACFVVAVFAPLARALDIHDPAFGRIIDVVQETAQEKIDEVVVPKKAAPAKKPVKKVPAVPKG